MTEAADCLGAVMDAESSGKKAVAKGDLEEVVMGNTRRYKNAGDQIGPGPDVLARVADDQGFAGCAGRRMNADHLAQGNRKHPVGIVRLHIVLGREGQTRQVGQRPHILRDDPEIQELLPIKGDVLVDAIERGLKTLQLKLLQLLSRHAFVDRIPDGVHSLLLKAACAAVFSSQFTVTEILCWPGGPERLRCKASWSRGAERIC